MSYTEPRIELLPKTKLVGCKMVMSMAHNRTRALWRSFMSKRSAINHHIGVKLYSVEIYHSLLYFKGFNPNRNFEKWAAVQVDRIDSIPTEMESLEIPRGHYAVFHYRGKSSDAPALYQHIFSDWIPNSAYELDHRPHLAIMGEGYKNDHPDSEEEIWIPIK